ncbi:hypothetical protein M758_UG200700 [Ceratodon purpureus]|nr:hypothetical protein M758_UG200700 [Ceratodon purpureus]
MASPDVCGPSRMRASGRKIPSDNHLIMVDIVEVAASRTTKYMKRHKIPDNKPWGVPLWRYEASLPSPRKVPPIVAASFFDMLPEEIVKEKLWPLLMDGQTPVENFQTLCKIRCVCSGTQRLVDNGKRDSSRGYGVTTGHSLSRERIPSP